MHLICHHHQEMKRTNVPVKIPPAPPSTQHPTYKPVQIGSPAGTPPSKPRRGFPKSPLKPDVKNQDHTLSDITIAFNHQSGSLNFSETAVYENLKKQDERPETTSSDELSDVTQGNVQLDGNCKLGNITNSTSAKSPVESSHLAQSCGTLDNFMIRSMSGAVYENIDHSIAQRNTFVIPDEAREPMHPAKDAEQKYPLSSCTLSPESSDGELVSNHQLIPAPYREKMKSAPASPVRRPPILPPTRDDTKQLLYQVKDETIYKDPSSLFREADEISSISFPTATDLPHSSCSPFTSNTVDDFIVMRHKQLQNGGKPRAISEIIMSKNGKVADLLKKSVLGRDYETIEGRSSSHSSTFYVDQNDITSHTTVAERNQGIASRIKKSIPESVVTSLTPAIFDIPLPNPSVFYTDKEEHIYSTSDSLGSLSYPGISVSNAGYRDPVVEAAERIEGSIPVRNVLEGTKEGSSTDHHVYAVPGPIT